ncbi:alpha/beta hydrolase [Streptomyces fructofermentans]|uniref:alpha/beta fold hydrolase n=1 Tax=Streptomyces fructofermentans TaxID=152141 RepID=UPI0033E375D4
MTFTAIDGVPHHLRVDGSGPVCLLTPGLGMCWFDWDRVVPLLARRRTVVRFDRPGLGLSGPARAWPTLMGEARRIARVLDSAGAVGPVTVVGHSLAGFHCEAFARLFPERTAGLVLVDSSVEEAPRACAAPVLRDAAARACGTLLSAAGVPRALGPLVRRTAVRAGRYGGRGDPAPSGQVRRAYSTSRSLRAVLAENARYGDEAAELAALRDRFPLDAPVTVLAADTGGGRRWLSRQRALAERLGGALRVSAPSGHFVMLDRPRDVADAVLDTPRWPSPAGGGSPPPGD